MHKKMKEIPDKYREGLENRIRTQIQLEVDGDIEKIYEYTLPTIREKRIAERNDEPQLSKNSIAEFVKNVKSANIENIEIAEFHTHSEMYLDNPAAVVVITVRYNAEVNVNRFKTIWVLYDGLWYSTALGKSIFR
jgi:hypothetical protein